MVFIRAIIPEGIGNRHSFLVQNIVAVAAGRNYIVAALQHITALCAVAIIMGEAVGSHIFLVEGDGNGVALTRLQQLGLAVVQQIDSGLFNHVLNIKVSVGGSVVQLYNILTSHFARIGNIDGNGNSVAGFRERRDFLGKGGVTQAITEGIHNAIIAVVIGVCHTVRQIIRSEVVHICGSLVPTVAHVNAFLILTEARIEIGTAFELG